MENMENPRGLPHFLWGRGLQATNGNIKYCGGLQEYNMLSDLIAPELIRIDSSVRYVAKGMSKSN